MSQKTKVSSLEIHLERILGDYLELSEPVKEFQTLKNRKHLSTGKYIFNRRLEKHVKDFQQQLLKLNYHSIQIEKELNDQLTGTSN